MKLLFATNNAHKLDEVRAILAAAGSDVELMTLADWPDVPEAPEPHDTFEANALEKARFVHTRTGLPCIADDSGIEVDALGGEPGVHSKRYSAQATGPANNALLLSRLGDRPDRSARFRCVLAYVNGPVERTVDGRCEGHIGTAEVGEGGFGYDPVFFPDEAPGRSMAELSMNDKNRISHRGRAFSRLPELLGD